MKKFLLPQNKNSYKANLGCYSSISLGSLTPQQLKKAYKSKGYSVVAFSDFEYLEPQSRLDDKDFLSITSCKTRISNYCFTLFSKEQNVSEIIPYPDSNEDIKTQVNRYITNARKNNMLVCIDHPAKSMQTFSDYAGIEGFFALEIADYSSLIQGYIEDNNHIYDRILRNSKTHVFPLACDGNCNIFPFESVKNDSFGAFTLIYAENLEYKAIINALENGEFYSSTGPTFKEIYIEDNKIHIKCSPVRSIRLLNEGRDAPVVIAPEGQLLTEAIFDIDPAFMGRFIRVDIRDKYGNFANTIPYYFENL